MTTLKELAKQLGITKPFLVQVLSQLGKKGYYKDSQFVTPEIIEDVKTFIQTEKEKGTQSALPPSNNQNNNDHGVLTQQETNDLGGSGRRSSKSKKNELDPQEMAIIQSAEAKGEVLADIASVVFTESFLARKTANETTFAQLYLNSLNEELMYLSSTAENKLLTQKADNKTEEEKGLDFLAEQKETLKKSMISLKEKYQLTPLF